jgi:outer membrane murein-binding lipoprotein Lpp
MINTNYFFSGSQLNENLQGGTASNATAEQADAGTGDARIPGWAPSTRWDTLFGKLDTLSSQVRGVTTGQNELAGKVGDLSSGVNGLNGQLTNQTRELNRIDDSIRVTNGKVDKIAADGEALSTAVGKLNGKVDGVDKKLGGLEDGLKLLAVAEGVNTTRVSALGATTEELVAAVSKLNETCGKTVIPHAAPVGS